MELLAVLSILILSTLFAIPETIGYYADELWANLAGPAVGLLVVGCLVFLLRGARAPPAPPARVRPRRLSEAKSEADGSDPLEQEVPPNTRSDDAVANSDPYEEDITVISPITQDDPTGNAIKQGVLPMSPSEPSDTEGHPLEQGIPNSLLSEIDVADSDLSKQDITPTSPIKEDILPIDPSEHGVADLDTCEEDAPPADSSEHVIADSGLLEQSLPNEGSITERMNVEEDNSRERSQLLDKFEEQLREIENWLTDNAGVWLVYSHVVDAVQGDPLRKYRIIQDFSGRATLGLRIVQGPANYTPETFQVDTETNVLLCDIIEFYRELTDGIARCFLDDTQVTKKSLEMNTTLLSHMREAISDIDASTRSRIDAVIVMIEEHIENTMGRGRLADSVLAKYANVIAKCQEALEKLSMMTITSDHLIARMSVPSGWETLEFKNGLVGRNWKQGQRSQGILTDGQRPGATVPAGIVDNVYELSRTFRGPSKETTQPSPEAMVQQSSVSSQVESSPRSARVNTQHSGEIRQLRKAQEDLEMLRSTVERLQEDRETSRPYREDTLNYQQLQTVRILGSRMNLYLEKGIMQPSETTRELWRDFVRTTTDLECQEPSATTTSTAMGNPTASTHGD